MKIQPFEGFEALKTHHCVTGSIRHIYHFNNHEVSEEMLLGIGGGVGFMYWHQKGQPPFMGGRRVPKPSMEEIAGGRTGVEVKSYTTSSGLKARGTLHEMLSASQPVMLQVDMGFLPYFDFGGEEYHFGGHAVVACGYDPENQQVLVADRDGVYPVRLEDLEKARGSTFKPFPPKNRWFSFDFEHKRFPIPVELRASIEEQAHAMLEPPIRNFGVEGIRKAARMIPDWHKSLDTRELKSALFNGYIFISPVGGSGGGNFRYMFSRFLGEAAVILKNPCLDESAAEFEHIGDMWEELGKWFRAASELPNPEGYLGECQPLLLEIADKEQAAWSRLQDYSISRF